MTRAMIRNQTKLAIEKANGQADTLAAGRSLRPLPLGVGPRLPQRISNTWYIGPSGVRAPLATAITRLSHS